MMTFGNESKRSRHLILLLILAATVALLALVLIFALGIRTVASSPQADCASPNVPSLIESNTVMSGTLFADSNVTVRNGAGLTLTAGTNFTFCGEHNLTANGGKLHLVGTKADPINFDSDDPNQKWGSIYFLGDASIVLTSTLQHVEINNGGGSNPSADLGAIRILGSSAGTSGYNPVIDHVTINDSGSYGIFVRVRANDPSPPALSNLTINGSASAPLLLYASAVGGLGGGHSFTNNGKQIIEVRVGGSLGGHIDHSQTWRDQPLPYELVGTGAVNSLTIQDAINLPVLTLRPGVTLCMGSDIFIRVNTGGLIAEGTASKPITITSVSGSGPLWRQIVFEAKVVSGSRLAHVNIEYAGSSNQPSLEILDGALSLDHVAVRFNNNAPGIYTDEPVVEIKNSTITFNKVGIHFDHGAGGLLRDNLIQGNIDAGIMVTDNSRKTCIDALGNNWGHASGPADSSNTLDNCNQAKTNNGGGDAVADDVLYDPWLGAGGLNDRSSISPDPFWVVADGLDKAQLTVTVRDASGLPLANKMVALSSTRGVIQQPSSPTDASGVTTAIISSTVNGDAYITAQNVTDDQPLAALAAIHFWSGGQETAGLIDPGGVPYVSPQLLVEGLPFQAGFPINFRLPMQNSNIDPVNVKVVYAVSGLNIGARYTPVDEVSTSLQPGESWDALGVWLPTVTGHHCVQATIEVAFLHNSNFHDPPAVDVGPWTVNFYVLEDPCEKVDPSKLIPHYDRLPVMRQWGAWLLAQYHLIKTCVGGRIVGSNFLSLTTTPAADRAYQQVVTPPVYTPPPLLPGDDVNEAQAIAATKMGEVVADLTSLDVALLETARRIQWAGQAGDEVASALQLSAYQEFQRMRAQKLADLAAGIDDLLDVTEGDGEPDTIYLPQDYQNYLNGLKSSGYEPDEIAFHQQFGLSSEEIAALLQAEIAVYEAMDAFHTTSYYQSQRKIRDAALQRSNELLAQYGTGQGLAQSFNADTPATYFLDATTNEFVVGNPMDSEKTVDLIVRPVEVPIGWTYNLSNPAPTLAAGETTTVTLSIDPDNTLLEETEVRLAVEGYIDGEYIGGILFVRRTPNLSAAADSTLYLPSVAK